jgi:regulator of sigma E protease
MPADIIETIRSIFAYVLVLGVLVFFHELGHFSMARARGVVVEVFSVGFGPTLLSRRAKSGTLWKLSALPLGGYVKMQGWGAEPADAEVAATPGSFSAATLGSKAMIIAAGPLANLVLAFVLFLLLFAWHGQTLVAPVLSQVQAGAPAAQAGLRAGDRIFSIGGQTIGDFEDLQRAVVPRPSTVLPLTYQRAGQTLQTVLHVGSRTEQGQAVGFLGVEGDQIVTKHLGPLGAVRAAAAETWAVTRATANGIWNLIVHQKGLRQLSGTIGIARLSGQVAAMGAASLISFMAMVSINLGLINLVPIPILDGGHLLFYAGEAIYGRPIPRRAQEVGLRFGFAVLLSLFVFTTVNDLTRLGALNWVVGQF